jgi:hypothetical protein
MGDRDLRSRSANGDSLSAELAELAIGAGSVAKFRMDALTALDRQIGFDLGAVLGPGAPGVGVDGSTLFDEARLVCWLAEFNTKELSAFAASCSVEIFEIFSPRRIAELAFQREFLAPHRIRACTTRSWVHRGNIVSVVLSRQVGARRFKDSERALLDRALPVQFGRHNVSESPTSTIVPLPP